MFGWRARKEPVSAPPVERKLAAAFAADIAGYSRLMARDEVGVRGRGAKRAPRPQRHQIIVTWCAAQIAATRTGSNGAGSWAAESRPRNKPSNAPPGVATTNIRAGRALALR
jgi:hypothetical protein